MTHANDPGLKSWIEVPEGSDFPIQNLPFGIFKIKDKSPTAGVAIGDQVLDLACLQENGFFNSLNLSPGIFNQQYLNNFIAQGRKKCGELRERISVLLRHGNDELKSSDFVTKALIPMKEVEMLMPVHIPNYTDFYSSEEHATNVGCMFRDPKNALLPNWKHLPVGYHGRASSVVVSGTPIRRPKGQIKLPDTENPIFSPSKKLDFELEVAFITSTNTTLGTSITTQDADDHIFGFVLFNDWSARDIQQWEYVPLGPFLGKNFGSTISPWIVTLDALEPFRVDGPTQQPEVLPYLKYSGRRNFDISLEVSLQPKGSVETVISRSNFKYMYWNVNQQLAHHTINGCNIEVGDLYASGTISGPTPDSYGSLLELTWNGKNELKLNDGTSRTFIEDGDAIIIRGYAEKDNVRIGFGECKGIII
ncbi:MAG TPA: fumarylacetoacetase [Cyclobacteriaceae bacterium]